MSLAERIALESPRVACTACAAFASLDDGERAEFREWLAVRARSKAAVSRVLGVTDTSYKRHVRAGHRDAL